MNVKKGCVPFWWGCSFLWLPWEALWPPAWGRMSVSAFEKERGLSSSTAHMGWEFGKWVTFKKYSANSPVRLSLVGTSVAVDGKATGNVLIRPLKHNGTVQIADGYAYRGAMEIMKSPRRWGLTIVNVVPMEEYLYGVVGKEMSPSWSLEALKAQAVAARTYAVAHKNYFRPVVSI